MHYTPHVDLAFASVEHIMRDVNNGWLLRYLHANGASMFFIAVYVHMAKIFIMVLYSPKRALMVFRCYHISSYDGYWIHWYVLPWGQMSFWGATVITNLASAIPFVGQAIVE